MKSTIKFEDTDMKWDTIYLALNMKAHEVIREGLSGLVPSRIVSQNYKGEKTVIINMEKGWCVNEGENL